MTTLYPSNVRGIMDKITPEDVKVPVPQRQPRRPRFATLQNSASLKVDAKIYHKTDSTI
jgi:hypothetical protein